MSDVQARLRRRWLYLPFMIAAVIVAGYYLLWRAGADEMKKAVAAWAEDQRAAGFDVRYDAMQTDGFPFFLRVHVERPYVVSPEGLSWRSERLSLDALPYQLDKIIFSAVGEQILNLGDHGEWRASAEELRASIARDETREWVFSANVGEMTARRESDGSAAAIERVVFDIAPLAEDATSLRLILAGAGIQYDAAASTLALDKLQLATDLTHTHLLSGEAPTTQWRDAGGEMVINGLIADLNAATLSIAGNISLDDRHYPTGRLRTEIANPAGIAESLGELGVMRPQDAEAAAAGLTLMALTSGGKITAPIELKNGAAAISGVKIVDLPQIK